MNTFALIKPIAKYNKVSYFSIIVGDDDIANDDEISLFENFIKAQSQNNERKLDHILNWLREIGNNYGAKSHYFRHEGETADTSALPPKGINRKPHYTEIGKKKSNNLRLYCLRANDNIVFLFNGELKTKKKAQDCPNVKPHFKLANRLTKAIDKAFVEGLIVWNEDCTQITYKEDLKIYF